MATAVEIISLTLAGVWATIFGPLLVEYAKTWAIHSVTNSQRKSLKELVEIKKLLMSLNKVAERHSWDSDFGDDDVVFMVLFVLSVRTHSLDVD